MYPTEIPIPLASAKQPVMTGMSFFDDAGGVMSVHLALLYFFFSSVQPLALSR